MKQVKQPTSPRPQRSAARPRVRKSAPAAAAPARPAAAPGGPAARWLLLVHQLPPRPPYLRAKIAQRLAGVGALPLKNSVYVLPASDSCREDFAWIAQEAAAGGGQAWIAEAQWIAGTDDEQLRTAFRAQADRAFDDLLASCRAELAGRRPAELAASGELPPLLASFRARLERLRARDFFAAPKGRDVAAWLDGLKAAGSRPARRGERASADGIGALRGKVWVTRRDVFVDRIATAWLVRRFLDPAARFRFVPGSAAPARAGQIRYDMADAEVTHAGDRCTFEVLLERLGGADAALTRIAQMVHDIDLRDARYGHPETAGLEQMLTGLVALERRDARRLDQGGEMLDRLYRALSALDDTPARPRRRRSARSSGERAQNE